VDIHPLNWQINFDETNFYPIEYGFEVPASSSIHSIFVSMGIQSVKPIPDRMIQGKALMYCYGFAAAQARRLYGNPQDFDHPDNYKELPKPVTIQLAFANESKKNLGFVCFQLNTLSFDSQVKNQVWFDGPHSYEYEVDRETILRKMVAFQLHGVDAAPRNITQNQKLVGVSSG
jgi:hypothetical protein